MATTSSFQAARDYSRAAYRIGSAGTTNRAFGAPIFQAGPRPFQPGTRSLGAAAVKIAHAVLTARYNQRLLNAWDEQQTAKAAEDLRYRQLQEADIAHRLAPPNLEDIKATAQAHEAGVIAGGGGSHTPLIPTHPKLAALGKYPEKMTVQDQGAAMALEFPKSEHRRTIPGLPGDWAESDPLVTSYYGEKAGLKTNEGKFNPRTPAETDALAMAHQNYENVVTDLKAQYYQGALVGPKIDPTTKAVVIDPKTKQPVMNDQPYNSDVALAKSVAGGIPYEVWIHPRHQVALRNLLATRRRSSIQALNRGKDVESLISGLELFPVGDPLLQDPDVIAARRTAAIRAARMATTPEAKNRIIALTEDQSDPLHTDPELNGLLGLVPQQPAKQGP